MDIVERRWPWEHALAVRGWDGHGKVGTALLPTEESTMNSLSIGMVSGALLMNLCAFAQTRLPESAVFTLTSAERNTSLRDRQLVVDQSADSSSGNCGRAGGQCNLRSAVAEAQRLGGESTIVLAVESVIDQGQILVAPSDGQSRLTIRGQDGMQTITGNGGERLFQLDAGAKLDLENVVISNFSSQFGGAIQNSGDLTIRGAIFRSNKSLCFGSGAMTAFATCGGGAIANGGRLILGDGTLFEDNEAIAIASTASFTTANASGGAIDSTGNLMLDGMVVFRHNTAKSSANSGFHPMPSGGAWANAKGGAVSSYGGSLVVSRAGEGKCAFLQNQATADASTPYGEATPLSIGGAISTNGSRVENLPSACSFDANFSGADPDVSIVP